MDNSLTYFLFGEDEECANRRIDVHQKPCSHKAILIYLTRHFDPHSKKETKAEYENAKFLTDNQNKEHVKRKHFSFNRESSVIEVLRKIFLKPCFLFVCF